MLTYWEYKIKFMEVITITEEAYEELIDKKNELSLIKQTIIESELWSYFPEKEMSFHKGLVIAIDKMAEGLDGG